MALVKKPKERKRRHIMIGATKATPVRASKKKKKEELLPDTPFTLEDLAKAWAAKRHLVGKSRSQWSYYDPCLVLSDTVWFKLIGERYSETKIDGRQILMNGGVGMPDEEWGIFDGVSVFYRGNVLEDAAEPERKLAEKKAIAATKRANARARKQSPIYGDYDPEAGF